MKIMLVEDNEGIILGLEYLLTQEGYGVLTAKSVSQARKIMEREECDLILLDVTLPDGNGFSFCSEMKKTRKIPVIFLTVKEEESDVVKGLDLGADDYVIKPFRNRELLSRIRSVLRRNGVGNVVLLQCGDIVMNPETGKVRRGDQPVELTKL